MLKLKKPPTFFRNASVFKRRVTTRACPFLKRAFRPSKEPLLTAMAQVLPFPILDTGRTWIANNHHLMRQTLCNLEPHIWLANTTKSRDSNSVCVEGSRCHVI